MKNITCGADPNAAAGATGCGEGSSSANSRASARAGRAAFLGWALILAFWFSGDAWGQVVLNELLADNASAVDNGDDFPDYIELYNRSTTATNVGSWRLTDDLLNVSKFIFPPNTIIPGQSHLLVWADDRTNSPGVHVGFGLNNKGESLFLINSSGFLADLVTFGLQLPDLSVGRVPDGTGPWVLNSTTPLAPNQREPLAEPTRLFFNEWAALNRRLNGELEDDWLEVYNATNRPVALGGIFMGDNSTNYALPALSFIGPNEFQQFIADDNTSPADHLPFKLSSSNGETLTLTRPDRITIIDQVIFGPQAENISEGRLPDAAPAPYRYFPGDQRTPGKSNFLLITNVVINEVLTHTDPPLEDAVELYNPTDLPVDISYWWLSDDRDDPRKFQIPPDTVLPPGGYKVFYEIPFDQGGFNPNGFGTDTSFTFNSAHGDEVNLFMADVSGNLTGFRVRQSFGPAFNGVSFGRYLSLFETNFVPMAQHTFGQDNPISLPQFRLGTGLTNALPAIPPVVINEIMYHPPDMIQGTNVLDNSEDEFIELYNRSGSSVLLYHPLYPTNTWHVRNAVSFNLPQGIIMPPGTFLLLVNFDPVTNLTQLASFRNLYQVPENVPIFGPYGGKLGNGGETLEWKQPDTPQTTPDDFGLVPYVDVERIKYDDEFLWPTKADGTGLALQRFQPEGFGNDPANWIAAEPTPGRLLVRIDAVEIRGGQCVLRFRQISGNSYTVQTRNSFETGNWSKLADYAAGSATLIREVSHMIEPGASSHFYRLVTPMQP